MTKKAMQGLAKRTKASNARFAKMTAAKKRVTVAKDVLEAIKLQQIIPEHGTYLEARRKSTSRDVLRQRIPGGKRGSFQELLPKLPPCQVCAKGAIFVCAVARQNAVKTGEAIDHEFDSDSLSESLGGLFSPEQLHMIELEFESWSSAVMDLWRFDTAEERMKAIMENIVANNGTFIPVPLRPPVDEETPTFEPLLR